MSVNSTGTWHHAILGLMVGPDFELGMTETGIQTPVFITGKLFHPLCQNSNTHQGLHEV